MNRKQFLAAIASGAIGANAIAQDKPATSTSKLEFKHQLSPLEYWTYDPQDDITVGELAVIMPLFVGMRGDGMVQWIKGSIEKHPAIARHFKHYGGTK